MLPDERPPDAQCASRAEGRKQSQAPVESESGRAYQGRLDQQLREPQLFECADYHRPTTAAGWVTFEVRDADAKGPPLYTCLGTFGSCETPAVIRLR